MHGRKLLMELRVLRYFLTVVREESITKAAAVLHITQPTLSRQLSQMEEGAGVKLCYPQLVGIIRLSVGRRLGKKYIWSL